MSFLLPISPVSTGKGRRCRQTNEIRGEAIVTGGERKALPEAQSADRKQLKVTVFVRGRHAVPWHFCWFFRGFTQHFLPLQPPLATAGRPPRKIVLLPSSALCKLQTAEPAYFCQRTPLTRAESRSPVPLLLSARTSDANTAA